MGCKYTNDAIGRVISKGQSYFIDKSELDIYNSDKVLLLLYPTKTIYDASGRTKKVRLPKTEAETMETSITFTYNKIETHSILVFEP